MNTHTHTHTHIDTYHRTNSVHLRRVQGHARQIWLGVHTHRHGTTGVNLNVRDVSSLGLSSITSACKQQTTALSLTTCIVVAMSDALRKVTVFVTVVPHVTLSKLSVSFLSSTSSVVDVPWHVKRCDAPPLTSILKHSVASSPEKNGVYANWSFGRMWIGACARV
jgi:hypothetical protein